MRNKLEKDSSLFLCIFMARLALFNCIDDLVASTQYGQSREMFLR